MSQFALPDVSSLTDIIYVLLLQNPVKFRNNTLYDFFLRETSTGLK
jgi:hypothetical protein